MKLVKIILTLVMLIGIAGMIYAAGQVDFTFSQNPVDVSTIITVTSTATFHGSLMITDRTGKVLKRIYSGKFDGPVTSIECDRYDDRGILLPAGEYICELRYDSKFTSVKKFILMK